MFGSRKQIDADTALAKFQDGKRESLRRLRSLHTAHDLATTDRMKAVYRSNYSLIYYLFHESFTALESLLKPRGGRVRQLNETQQEDLYDVVLLTLERILIYIPEQVQRRWQANSMGLVIRKLLHEGNQMKLRRKAVQFMLLWIQDLQTNTSADILELFGLIVPGVNLSTLSESTEPSYPVLQTEIAPILPAVEAPTDETTKELLNCVLQGIMYEFQRIFWDSVDQRVRGFVYLFEQFKAYYIKPLFQDMEQTPSVYNQAVDIAMLPVRSESVPSGGFAMQHTLQDMIIRWFLDQLTARRVPRAQLENLEGQLMSPTTPNTPGMTESSFGFQLTGDLSLLSKERKAVNARRFLRQVLMSKKDNVNLVHCIFRQGFHLPLTYLDTIKSLVALYQKWIQEPTARPRFMQEPERQKDVIDGSNSDEVQPLISPLTHTSDSFVTAPQSLDTVVEADESSLCKSESVSGGLASTSMGAENESLRDDESEVWKSESAEAVDMSTDLETEMTITATGDASSLTNMSCDDQKLDTSQEDIVIAEAVKDANLASSVSESKRGWTEDVRAGLQSNLRLFITNVATVFTIQVPAEFLDNQVDLISHHVLQFLQMLARDVALDQCTWEHMLATLLHITQAVLKMCDPESQQATLASRTASNLLKTLFVSWVRANLFVSVSTTLWNDLLEVLSSQTRWIQVVLEWKKIMVILTRLLAKHLYNLDMNKLPLDVLKQSARRGKETTAINSDPSRKRTSFVTGLAYLNTDKLMQVEHLNESGNRTRARTTAAQTSASSSNEDPVQAAARQAMRKAKQRDGKATERQQTEEFRKGRSSSASEAEMLSVFPQNLDESKLKSGNSIDLFPKQSTMSLPSLQRRVTISNPDVADSGRPVVVRRKLPSTPSEDDKGKSPPRLIDLASIDTDGGTSNETSNVKKQGNSLTLTDKRQRFNETISVTIDVGALERDNELLASRYRDTRAKSEGTLHNTCDAKETQSLLLQSVLEEQPGETVVASAGTSPWQQTSETQSQAQDGSIDYQSKGGLETSSDIEGKRVRNPSKSVIAGGTKRGWTDIAAAILWRQMIGILGNVNDIKKPNIHCEAVKCLAEVWEALYKVKQNQGIVLEDGTPVVDVVYSPPLFAIAPLVFQAAGKSVEYKAGRLVAYKLMCDMTVKRHDVPPSSHHLDHFYRLIQAGLRLQDQDFLAAIFSHSYKIFSLPFPGVTVTIPDYIEAADRMLSSTGVSPDVPRLPALAATGSLLFFPRLYNGVAVEGCMGTDDHSVTFQTIENKLIDFFVKSARDEKSRMARCLAVSVVGLFVYSELAHKNLHSKLNESLQVILNSLMVPEKLVALVTIDMIHLLGGVMNNMLELQPSLPGLIVEVVAYTLSVLLVDRCGDENEQKIVVAMLTCLLDLFMLLPLNIVSMPARAETGITLRGIVFQVFSAAATSSPVSFDAKTSRKLLLTQLSATNTFPTIVSVPNVKKTSVSPPRSAPPVGSPAKAFTFPSFPSDVVKLTARSCLSRLSVLYGHYPFACGAAQISSRLSERDDNPACEGTTDTELSNVLFNSPNVQFLSYQNNTIITVIELPGEDKNTRECRVITRDMTGKFSWDVQLLHSTVPLPSAPYAGVVSDLDDQFVKSKGDRRSLQKPVSVCRSVPQFPDPLVLPTHKNVNNPDADLLDRLLVHIGATSLECVADTERQLNHPDAPPVIFKNELQSGLIDVLHAQDFAEKDNYVESQKELVMVAEAAHPSVHKSPLSPFYHCQLLLSYMGLLSWEQRSKVELLKKQDALLRELKHLDQRRCRETHKIAVLYVGRGQEDKQSIMGNSRGSRLFEEFVAGLAWEVDLGNHPGFMGGLPRNQTTGSTAPYYATPSVEVIFHVATRFPVNGEGTQWLLNKVRHLGNDEIQIVWSEHTRDYRGEIIKTQFGDVYIVIYPLPNSLFRIQIIKKPEVHFFGPLFDGAIVDMLTLPHLVRETALNASRAKRSQMSYYQQWFEDRANYLENTINKLRRDTTFEEFMTSVVRPAAFVSEEATIPVVTVTSSEEGRGRSRNRSQWSPLASSEQDETDTSPGGGPFRQRANTFTHGDRLRHPSPLARLGKLLDRNDQLSLPDGLNKAGSPSSPSTKQRRSSSDRAKRIV
ncbi:ral GTPase-activating protein subunit alpha-2-like isoform X2 [Corticium candelabrum]|uniref:ral GTPase-activating protein subunit alpha-2-like isoform X2 n=1 Tax=Corticium candelabrum TaxID=121492 RepID=UPI002E26A523|nr:ral GTPase-activating protein subunit alpha-2-like isoform X2 [Corticium candelabrum]